MAKLDLKKMKQKLVESKQRGKGGKFWKPKDGKQDIRIVPTEDGDPFKSFHFHYNVGETGFMCPKRNFGDECPVCNFSYSLYREGDDESVKMAKDISAKQRFFSPVIVRGEEDGGVKIWGYSKTVYETLLGLILNPDFGDITDTEEGVDLTLTYGKQAGAQYPSTDITPRRKSSPLCGDDSDDCTELLDSVPNFEELYERVSTEEVQAKLDGHLSVEEDNGESPVLEPPADSGASSVDDAFKDLAS